MKLKGLVQKKEEGFITKAFGDSVNSICKASVEEIVAVIEINN